MPLNACKICSALNLLGGLPFRVRVQAGSLQVLEDVKLYRRCLAQYVLISVIGSVIESYVFYYVLDTNLGQIVSFFLDVGGTITDALSTFSILFLCQICQYISLLRMKKAVKSLKEMLQSYKGLGKFVSPLEDTENAEKSIRLIIWTWWPMIIIVPIGYSAFTALAFPAEFSLTQKLYVGSAHFLFLVTIIFPFPQLTRVLMCYYGLSTCQRIILNFKDHMQNMMKYGEEQKKEAGKMVGDIVSDGNLIVNLIQDASIKVGPLLLSECEQSFLFGILGLYLAAGFPFNFQCTMAALRQNITWGFCAAAALGVLANAGLRFKAFLDFGTDIETELSAIKEETRTLERFARSNLANNSTITMEIRHLKERLHENQCIRPCGVFNLNYEMGLGALGVFFTYFVVLLQFRISE